MGNKIIIVIPCFNEAKRLDMAKFCEFSKKYHLIFVNDGSTDNTLEVLNKHKSSSTDVIDLKENSGKGEAVRQGMLFAIETYKKADWLGYIDADLSVPFEELDNCFLYTNKLYPDTDAVIGSRVKRLGANIQRSFLRHLIGRCFATLFSLLFNIKTYDSQCGLKFFRSKITLQVFEKKFLAKWIFDLEIIFRMDGAEIIEYPLKTWKEVSGSKVLSVKAILSIFKDIIKLKLNY